jgi:hypothetical protein
MTNQKIDCYKMTFEAIQSVRKELSLINPNDVLAISETLQRLAMLYSSIDAKQFIECMNELESERSILKVNFKKTA